MKSEVLDKENTPINVAFFGTSDRSIPILESLKESFNLNLVVTKTDTKVGRKQVLRSTAVKKWAQKNKVNYIEIESTKDEDKKNIIKHLKVCKSEIGVVADFSFMIPQEVLNTPKHGLLNIHFSLLPKYRGASPVQFAILNNDKKTGFTIYKMDKGMDTGEILYQEEYLLQGTETSGELYEILFYRSAMAIPQVILGYISGSLALSKQLEEHSSYTYSKTHSKHTFIYKEDAKINWSETNKSIEQQIRAFHPWPIAWTTLEEFASRKDLKLNLKDTVDKSLRVKVYTAHMEARKLKIDKLQIEGKQIIGWDDFLNGYTKKVM